jgi:hypothetical protein
MKNSYAESQHINLRNNKELDEKWLQGKIYDNPDLLGISNGLSPISIERKQSNGGRLDLLLEDENETRYAVEIQLGATDEAHIIRTIEYWDNERSRNPHIEHIAVIVAEDVTSRFLNVISLFNKSIPLIAIQLKAFQVGEHLTLIGTKVLDLRSAVGDDIKTADQPADRAYWNKKTSAESLKIVDRIFEIVKDKTNYKNLQLNYTKPYISFSVDGVSDNFIVMKPRVGGYVQLDFNKIPTEENQEFLESLDQYPTYDRRTRRNVYIFKIKEQELNEPDSIILKMIDLSLNYSRLK